MKATVSASTLLVATAVLALGGCGQKGPLYLPDRNPSVVGGGVPPPAQSRLAVPAPAPQAQSAPEQTIPGSPAQPLVKPVQNAPPRDTHAEQPPKRDSADSDSPAPQ